MPTNYEAAHLPGRLQFVRETTTGTFETDPAYNLFSDNVRDFEATIEPNVSEQRGLDDPDVVGAFTGSNADAIDVAYDLQQKSASGDTLTDGSNPNDAVTDALERDSDNKAQNTHQVVRRKEQSSIDSSNTINGSTSLDTRQYVVGTGCFPAEATITGDPSDGQPILVELTYECERVDHYQLDQPSSSSTIDVISSNANDSGSVTIEDEGAGTAEDVTITADGTASTTATFSDLDAIELSAEQPGDITISDGTNDLMVIRGQNSLDHGEGQLGIPALGSGSNASAIGQDYELYHDDAIDQPSGTTIADGFEATEFSVANSIDGVEQGTTPRRALSFGNRELTASITVFGETERQQQTVDMIQTSTDNLRFDLAGPTDGGYLQLDTAFKTEVTASESVGDAKMMTDLSLMGQGVTVSN